MRKNLIIAFVIMTILLSAVPVFAASDQKTANSLNIVTPKSYNNLEYGYSSLSDLGNGTVSIYGYTMAYDTVDQIGINFYLQYYKESTHSWVNLRSYDYNKLDSSSITKNIVVSVSRGYTYRLYTKHYTYDNGVRESGVSVTGGVYVP